MFFFDFRAAPNNACSPGKMVGSASALGLRLRRTSDVSKICSRPEPVPKALTLIYRCNQDSERDSTS
jgi:hypothetical protein